MKPTLVCVFAHPDDEAFGPGGTIAKFSQTHNVYLLCATRGEAGGHHQEKNIASIRENELLESAKTLGVKGVNFLGFIDGKLCNEIYPALVEKIKEYIIKIGPQTLLTFEPRGVSGHIDHITVSLATSYVFEHLSFLKKLLYFCQTEEQVIEIKKIIGDYFVYFPPGYKQSEISETIDISTFWDKKITAMKKHQSQIQDVNMIIKFLEKIPKQEHFLILKK